MSRTKKKDIKDMVGQSYYKNIKKHPILKNPITLMYIAALILIVISYVIYLIIEST